MDELPEVDVAQRESPARPRYRKRLRPSADRQLRPASLVCTSGLCLEPKSRPIELDSVRYGIAEHRNEQPSALDNQAGQRFIRRMESRLAAHRDGATRNHSPGERSDCHQAAVDISPIAPRTRKRKEDEKPPSDGPGGCWNHHRRPECRKAHAASPRLAANALTWRH